MSLPLGEVNEANPLVSLSIAVGDVGIGELLIELKADVVPITVRACSLFLCPQRAPRPTLNALSLVAPAGTELPGAG